MSAFLALVFFTLALSQGNLSLNKWKHVTAAPQKAPCVCGVSFDGAFNKSVSLSHRFNVSFDCDDKGEQDCKLLCIAFGDAKVADPNGTNKLCKKLKLNVDFQPHVFSKVCTKDFVNTGKMYPNFICCKDLNAVPC